MKYLTPVAFVLISTGLAFGQATEAPKPAAQPEAPKAPAAPKPPSAPQAPAAPFGKPLDFFEGTEFTTVSADGHFFTEGPLWWNGKLYFCDLAGDSIGTVVPGAKAEVIRNEATRPAGAAVDMQGRLLIAHFGGGMESGVTPKGEKTFGGRVTRTELDGTITTILDSIDGKPMGPCNDLVVRADGSIYVTDFGGGKDGRSLIRIAPDGKTSILPSTFQSANGIAFSPDESVLYVAEYKTNAIKAFDVTTDGSLSNERVLVDLKDEPGRGKCDGLKVDVQGNIYTTGPGGVWVISPRGEKLARLDTPGSLSNVAFGGADRKTLFITAGSKIYSVKTKIAGAASKAPATAPTPPAKPAAKPGDAK
jgi:gluconolactonase